MKSQSAVAQNIPNSLIHKRFEDLTRIINQGVSFGDPTNGSLNIDGFWLNTVTPSPADTEFTVTHNLGRIPAGIIVIAVDKAAIIYASRKNSWTTTQSFFKANVATVVLTGFIV